MVHIDAGDLVVALSIDDCAIGHPDWHEDFANPDMNEKHYMVIWSGFSVYWQRPVISVAGRPGHFCAGCFAKAPPPSEAGDRRVTRETVPA